MMGIFPFGAEDFGPVPTIEVVNPSRPSIH